jgi:hypothetical protein
MSASPQERGPGGSAPGGDGLQSELRGVLDALGDLAVTTARSKLTGLTQRLADYVGQQGQGNPGLMAALTGARSMAEGKSPVRSMLSAGWPITSGPSSATSRPS